MQSSARLRFGRFELRRNERQLLQDDRPVALGARAFDLLVALIERRDRLVTKAELLDLVWSGLVVEEANLAVQVSALRKHIGVHSIATVPGRGYQFVSAVEADGATAVIGRNAAFEPALGGAPDEARLFQPYRFSEEVRADSSDAKYIGAQRSSQESSPPTVALTQTSALGNVPRRFRPLYGRGKDMSAVADLVRQHQIVTIVGAGGIGKTSLALTIAHDCAAQWPDGAWIVELASLADPALVPFRVAQALGIELGRRNSPVDELVAMLHGRSMLLVLDNSEHLIDAVSALVRTISRRTEYVHVLVTSQERLKVEGEQVYRLATLDVPESESMEAARSSGAVALFVERAHALDPGFALEEANVGAVVDICRQLDGLALAIELAASRAILLGVQEVRQRLGDSLRLLVGGLRSALPRHQTLRGTFDWSHALLSDRERLVFRRLGVFSGGFTLELAQAIVADERLDGWEVTCDLATLIDRSLITADGPERRRYRFLESARSYALERLADAGELDSMQKRHAAGVRGLFERLHDDMLASRVRPDRGNAEALPEVDNLRAAVAWSFATSGESETALSLAVHSAYFLRHHGLANEARHWIFALKDYASGPIDPKLQARYWMALAVGSQRGGLPAHERIVALQRAEVMHRTAKEDVPLGFVLNFLAHMHIKVGDVLAARRYHTEVMAMRSSHWPPALIASAVLRGGVILAAEGRLSEALTSYSEAMSLFEAAGDSRSLFGVRVEYADLLMRMGHVDEAVVQTAQLANIARASYRNNNVMGLVLVNLARALTAKGRLNEAQAVAAEALPYLRRSADVRAGCDCFAWLLARLGRVRDAARLIGAADAWLLHSGETRLARDQEAHDAALVLALMRHSKDEVECWRAEGAVMGSDDVDHLLSNAPE